MSGASDPIGQSEVPIQERSAQMFTGAKAEPEKRRLLFGTAAALVLIVGVGGVVVMHRSPAANVPLNAVLPADPYSTNIGFSQLAMSESTSLSGGKSTFIDGHVKNSGGKTLTGVTMQVLFKNDEGLAPTVETLPLTLVRTHEPYVDTEAVEASPLTPGNEVEFRLIVETVPPNWNQQMPELRVVHLANR